jgi:hypothetical protein
MKVVHVLKKIENIDDDIRELRKLEKSLARNKSFSTPIYMSIEKQINILLGDKIKMMELKIDNPPKEFLEGVEEPAVKPAVEDEVKKKQLKAPKAKPAKAKAKKAHDIKDDFLDDTIPLMTQDIIDQKIKNLEGTLQKSQDAKKDDGRGDTAAKKDGDEHIKLLDIALEKGTISKNDIESEKKKVRFFKDNFPGGEY